MSDDQSTPEVGEQDLNFADELPVLPIRNAVLFPGARVTAIIPPFFFWPFAVPALLFLVVWFGSQFLLAGQETLVAWDGPEVYGVACKRVDARDPATASRFNRRGEIHDALALEERLLQDHGQALEADLARLETQIRDQKLSQIELKQRLEKDRAELHKKAQALAQMRLGLTQSAKLTTESRGASPSISRTSRFRTVFP